MIAELEGGGADLQVGPHLQSTIIDAIADHHF
jgi:hypothetical protein